MSDSQTASARVGRRNLVYTLLLLGLSGLGVLIGLRLGPMLGHPAFLGASVGGGIGAAIALSTSAWLFRRAAEGPPESCGTPAGARLGAAISAFMAGYVLDVVLISWVFDLHALPYWPRIAAVVSPALWIGGVIWALVRYLDKEPDEFQRLLMTKAVLLAAGVTFFLLTAWGFLEFYRLAPHFPTGLVMAAFWMVFGVCNGWVRWRYR